ncbi:putative wall-associated receptor kinase [Helianthus debilis subsp. tardiflorus]
MDPMVTLFGSIHEKQNETGSMIFPNFESMFHGDRHKPDNWDVESNHENGNLSVDETDDNVKSPLLSLNSTSVDKDMIAPVSRSILNADQPSESISVIGIGGGWQLAYRKTEDGKKAGGLQRIYLHQETLKYTRSKGGDFSSGCLGLCRRLNDVPGGYCSGIGCCQTSIPKGLKTYNVTFTTLSNHTGVVSNPCGFAFLGEEDSFQFRGVQDLTNASEFYSRVMSLVPTVLEWVIESNRICREANECKGNISCSDTYIDGYCCSCNSGYEGNPYLDPGCQGCLLNSVSKLGFGAIQLHVSIEGYILVVIFSPATFLTFKVCLWNWMVEAETLVETVPAPAPHVSSFNS